MKRCHGKDNYLLVSGLDPWTDEDHVITVGHIQHMSPKPALARFSMHMTMLLFLLGFLILQVRQK